MFKNIEFLFLISLEHITFLNLPFTVQFVLETGIRIPKGSHLLLEVEVGMRLETQK